MGFPVARILPGRTGDGCFGFGDEIGAWLRALSDVAQDEKICGAQESVAHVAARADGDEIRGSL